MKLDDEALRTLRSNILNHVMRGGKASVKEFGSDHRKYQAVYKFWKAYVQHIKDKDLFHVVCGFRHPDGSYVLVEAFTDEADAEFTRNGEAGVLRSIELQSLTSEEYRLKKSGCSSVGNYALPGCRLTSTDEFSAFMRMIHDGVFVPEDAETWSKSEQKIKWWEFWK